MEEADRDTASDDTVPGNVGPMDSGWLRAIQEESRPCIVGYQPP